MSGAPTLLKTPSAERAPRARGTHLAPVAPAASALAERRSYDGLERRATQRLEHYWLSLRWAERGPFFQDFQPGRNPVPWENCLLATIAENGALAFDHVGRTIIALFGRGPSVAAPTLAEIAAERFGDFREALSSGRPLHREDEVVRADGTGVLYRSVLLPFVDLRRRPTYVLAAVSYRLEP